jgi:succinate dehydrogenase / fumarate reductase membrane anchor subunit
MSKRDLRSDIARVRGLGSAKEGVAHWWAQRVTAIALVPLTIWFIISLLSLLGSPRAAVTHWASHPINTALLLALVVATFQHTQLGLQAVIEDYVHIERVKMAALLVMKGVVILLGLL